jgi:Zn-dependent M16 (insulinase) family peptidase
LYKAPWLGFVQDYYNLVDVYLDAVLHPACIADERTFAQEGWHYELENPEVIPLSCAGDSFVPLNV